jgi:hypothetical protein
MTTVDYLVLAPIVPALPVIATWWLPWERWIPWVKFAHLLGPYLLYGAFAAWYFGMVWWGILIFAIAGATLTATAIGASLHKTSTEPADEP